MVSCTYIVTYKTVILITKGKYTGVNCINRKLAGYNALASTISRFNPHVIGLLLFSCQSRVDVLYAALTLHAGSFDSNN